MGRKSRNKKLNTQGEYPEGTVQAARHEVIFQNNNKIVLHWLLLAVLIVGVYANSINNEFVWDDIHIIKENTDIKSLGNTFKLLLSEDTLSDIKSNYYRPITYLSFMVDYALWKGSPKGFHAVNILLHLIFSCLLYLFARDILGSSTAALATALIFALHPAATETVNFISGGRNTLLCGVFLLAAILSHRKDKLPITLLFFTLSTFSKEFGLLFPVIAALTDRYFPRAAHDKTKDARTYFFYAVVIVFYLLMRSYVVGGSGLDLKTNTLLWRILLVPKIIITYLKVIALPYKLTVPYYFPLPGGINSEVIIYTVALILTISFLYYFRRFTTVSFSSLWFFVFLLPVLNVIPLGEFTAAERYIYIALAGFAILLGAITEKLEKRFFLPAVIVVCVLYSIVVINRNQVWKNNYSLFSDAVKKSPDSPSPRISLGNAYLAKGMTNEAINEYQIATKLNAGNAMAHMNLGNAYKTQGRINEAINEYQIALKLVPDYFDAHYDLGIAYKDQGKTNEAINEYKIALQLKPGNDLAHNNLGTAYLAQDKTDAAINEYQTVIKINPDNAMAHMNLGNAYFSQGRKDKAINEYQIALKLDPAYFDAHYNLGIAYKDQGKTNEAINEYKIATKLKPGNITAHMNLGNVYFTQGNIDEAINEYQIVLKLNPDYFDAHYNLGVSYKALGRTDKAINEYQIALRLKPGDAKARQNLDIILKK